MPPSHTTLRAAPHLHLYPCQPVHEVLHCTVEAIVSALAVAVLDVCGDVAEHQLPECLVGDPEQTEQQREQRGWGQLRQRKAGCGQKPIVAPTMVSTKHCARLHTCALFHTQSLGVRPEVEARGLGPGSLVMQNLSTNTIPHAVHSLPNTILSLSTEGCLLSIGCIFGHDLRVLEDLPLQLVPEHGLWKGGTLAQLQNSCTPDGPCVTVPLLYHTCPLFRRSMSAFTKVCLREGSSIAWCWSSRSISSWGNPEVWVG